MQVRLAGTERALLGMGGTSNATAYDWFLRGRYALNKGTRPAIRTAISAFDSAIAYDPKYAKAYANLAEVYVIGAANRELDPEESLGGAVTSARRAIALAPGLSEGHAALGRAELELWHWNAAENEVVRAVRLDPRNASAHATYARVLMVRSRLREAEKEAEIAMRLEPLSATITQNYAESLRAMRKYPQSAKFYRKGLELEPELGRQNLAKVYIEMALYDSARAQFRAALAAGAPRMRNVPMLWSAYINARAGNRTEASQLAQEFQDRTPRGPNSYMLAAVYLSVENYDRALQLAEIGVQDRNMPAWRQLPWDPIWNPVRHDKRFAQVLQQMGL
jgi:Tfp pilus assembly protein PilF